MRKSFTWNEMYELHVLNRQNSRFIEALERFEEMFFFKLKTVVLWVSKYIWACSGLCKLCPPCVVICASALLLTFLSTKSSGAFLSFVVVFYGTLSFFRGLKAGNVLNVLLH